MERKRAEDLASEPQARLMAARMLTAATHRIFVPVGCVSIIQCAWGPTPTRSTRFTRRPLALPRRFARRPSGLPPAALIARRRAAYFCAWAPWLWRLAR